MPLTAPTNRISVSTAGMVQQKLLEYQAALTGRSISSLASSLLEEIIDQKVQAGQWHPTAIRLVEELIKEREAYLAFAHSEVRAGIRAEIEAGDRFLVCTDGLYKELPLEKIQSMLGVAFSEHILADLIDEALRRGGRDNITGIVVDVR